MLIYRGGNIAFIITRKDSTVQQMHISHDNLRFAKVGEVFKINEEYHSPNPMSNSNECLKVLAKDKDIITVLFREEDSYYFDEFDAAGGLTDTVYKINILTRELIYEKIVQERDY